MTAPLPDLEALSIAAVKSISDGDPNRPLASGWDSLWLVDALATERERADQAEARIDRAPHEVDCMINFSGCMEERCQHRHWTSGRMPTHAHGNQCPPRTLVCDCWKSEATA